RGMTPHPVRPQQEVTGVWRGRAAYPGLPPHDKPELSAHRRRPGRARVASSGRRAGRGRPAQTGRTAAKIDAGAKATGRPTLAQALGEQGPAIVERARAWLGIADKAPPEVPLPAEPPWPDLPAEKAFHGLAGRVVRVIEPASEADAAALLVQ